MIILQEEELGGFNNHTCPASGLWPQHQVPHSAGDLQPRASRRPSLSRHCGPGQWQPRVLTSVPCISHRTCTACWGLWVTAGSSYGNPSDAVGSPLFCIWWEPPRWSLLRCLLRSSSLALSWGARNKKGRGRPAGPWGSWLTVTVKFQTRGMWQVLKLNQSC